MEGFNDDGAPRIRNALCDTSNVDDGAGDFELYCHACHGFNTIPDEWVERDWSWE